MKKKNKLPQNYEEMHRYAKEHGFEKTKELLCNWVANGQGNELMPKHTWREMCIAASAGLEGLPIDVYPESYLFTKFGPSLYDAMSLSYGGEK